MSVVIVEDEQKLADSLAEGLQSEGKNVEIFYDGIRAFEWLSSKEATYSFIILDLMLPGKSGFDIARELRAKGVVVPILVLTAKNSIEDKVEALDSGADDLITKPFSFDELLARMRALDRRAREVSMPLHKVADLTLDPTKREVVRGGKVIGLTFKEFELLFFLMKNQGSVKTRDEIVAYLWGTAEEDLGNVVDVHIRNLRKKIDDDYLVKIIRTVRGVGYAI